MSDNNSTTTEKKSYLIPGCMGIATLLAAIYAIYAYSGKLSAWDSLSSPQLLWIFMTMLLCMIASVVFITFGGKLPGMVVKVGNIVAIVLYVFVFSYLVYFFLNPRPLNDESASAGSKLE